MNAGSSMLGCISMLSACLRYRVGRKATEAVAGTLIWMGGECLIDMLGDDQSVECILVQKRHLFAQTFVGVCINNRCSQCEQ